MDGPRFDQLARNLAHGPSRRSFVKAFAAGLGALAGRGVAGAAPSCRNEGHPCEGNQTCCDQLVCVVSGPGKARRCTPCPEGTVFVDGTCCTPDNAAACSGKCGQQTNNCQQIVECGGEGTTTCGIGACERTVENCVGGVPQSCVPGEPQAEICNGIDDDCDGVIDNGNPGGGVGCDTGQPGVCAAGTTACDGGQIVCVPNAQPSAEVCDGLDNDCDGEIDNGDPGGGLACDTGLPGGCAAGTTRCEDGGIVCLQNVQPDFDNDPLNCGSCGNVCSTDACVGGVCFCPNAVLSGGPDPTTAISVDDDLEIERNGGNVFSNNDEVASTIPPIAFANLVNGESLRVIASNSTTFAAFQSLSPLYLHCPSSGAVQVLDADGHPTDTGPGGNVFYDETFAVAL